MNSDIFNHHAHFALGGHASVPNIISLLEEQGFKTAGNPDFWVSHFVTFGVDESRLLKEMDSRQSLGERKVFVISYDTITSEAQNALLKTFEEPLGGSHYFICVSREEELLPTLRSRLIKIDIDKGAQDLADANKFLKMSLDERMVFAHKFAEDIKKEKKTKKDALVFLDNLEVALHKTSAKYNPADLKKLLELKQYASINGSSVKMIMETVGVFLS